MRGWLKTVWGQITAITLACMVASFGVTLSVTYLATGLLDIGIGAGISLLVPALVVPLGSYWHISLAHRLRHVNGELRRLSETDSLTGVCNRRHFIELAERQLALAHRHGYPTSVLLIDFDHFKTINDRFGHGGGDHVLKDATAAIGEVLRDSDILARFGGEEFIVLLPHTATEGARIAADRIMTAVRERTFRHDDQDIQVTVSIGGVGCHASRTPLDRMTSRADSLLYAAKHAGRDRCCIEDMESARP